MPNLGNQKWARSSSDRSFVELPWVIGRVANVQQPPCVMCGCCSSYSLLFSSVLLELKTLCFEWGQSWGKGSGNFWKSRKVLESSLHSETNLPFWLLPFRCSLSHGRLRLHGWMSTEGCVQGCDGGDRGFWPWMSTPTGEFYNNTWPWYFCKASWYKWEAHRDTNWRCTHYFQIAKLTCAKLWAFFLPLTLRLASV